MRCSSFGQLLHVCENNVQLCEPYATGYQSNLLPNISQGRRYRGGGGGGGGGGGQGGA